MSLQIPGVTPVNNIEEIYPGSPLKLGDISQAVLYTKNALNCYICKLSGNSQDISGKH